MNDSPINSSPFRRRFVPRVAIGLLGMLIVDCGLITYLGWAERQPPTNLGLGWLSTVLLLAAMVAIGCIAAQFMLFVSYTALGDGSSFRRILYTTFTFVLFTIALGSFTRWWLQAELDQVMLLLLIFLLMYFVFQIPLWGIRTYFGWTIQSPWAAGRDHRSRRFSLAHLLGWSVFLAMPLCILQVFTNAPSGSMGPGPLIFFFWAVLLSLLVMWVTYATLTERIGLRRSVLITLFILCVAAGLQNWVMSIGQRGGTGMQEFIMVSTANLSAGFTTFLVFRIAYRVGFRLLPFASVPTETTVGWAKAANP